MERKHDFDDVWDEGDSGSLSQPRLKRSKAVILEASEEKAEHSWTEVLV